MEKIKLIDLVTHRYVARLNKENRFARCKQCVFFDETSCDNCAMNLPNTVITKDNRIVLLAHCIKENRYYQCVSYADNDITIDNKKYYLIKSYIVNNNNKYSCKECAFLLSNGSCKLFDYENQNKIDNFTYKKCINNADNYIWIEADKFDLVKPQDIGKESVIKFNEEEMEEVRDKNLYSPSSTGVVDSKNVSTSKESKVSNNTTRRLTKEVTLKEARGWYNSYNKILRNFALHVFSETELKDVRTCMALIDIDTAKRLYRNAEKAVRDFVLSAFTEDELKK